MRYNSVILQSFYFSYLSLYLLLKQNYNQRLVCDGIITYKEA